MRELAATLANLVDSLDNPTAIPVTFGYAARARLHDRTNWSNADSDEAVPSTALIEELSDLLRRPRAIECRRNYYWQLVDGLTNYTSGDIDAAWKRFALTAQSGEIAPVFQNDDLAGAVSLGRCFPGEDALESSRRRRFTRAPEIAVAPSRDRQFTIVVAVDPVYAEAFVPVWLEALSSFPRGEIGFHLHLMAPADAAPEVVGMMQGQAAQAGVDLSVSIDSTRPTDRAYFTCSRFLCGGAIMDAVGSPLLLCDADLVLSRHDDLFRPALAGLLQARGCRAIINRRFGHGYLPWRHVSASLVFVANDGTGRDYLETTSRFIEYFWNDTIISNWWIDQFALESARLLLARRNPATEACTRIDDRIRRSLVTPPTHKSDRLSRVPRVRKLLDSGLNIHRALEVLSTRADTK